VTIPATVPQRSDIPEGGLLNYPVFNFYYHAKMKVRMTYFILLSFHCFVHFLALISLFHTTNRIMHTYTTHFSLLALCNCNMFRASKDQFSGVLLIYFHSHKYNNEDKLIQEQILGENNPLFTL
jgi:hypothetical protein